MQNFDSDVLGKVTFWSSRGWWDYKSKMDLRKIVRDTGWIELANCFDRGFRALILCALVH
jgi:hypothetical protein